MASDFCDVISNNLYMVEGNIKNIVYIYTLKIVGLRMRISKHSSGSDSL